MVTMRGYIVPALLLSIGLQVHCMEQKKPTFDPDQVWQLQSIARENPENFDALSEDIAQQLFEQNPNITRRELVNFFQPQTSHAITLPLSILQRIWNFIEILKIRSIIDQVKLSIHNPLEPDAETRYIRNHYSFARDTCVIAMNESSPSLTTIDTTNLGIRRNGSTFRMIGLFHAATYAHTIIADNDIIIAIPNVAYIHGITDQETLMSTMYQAVENGQARHFADFEEAFEYLCTLADR